MSLLHQKILSALPKGFRILSHSLVQFLGMGSREFINSFGEELSMVTVHSLKHDKCVWCAKEQDGVMVTFDDGSISGFVCWSDFRKLLKARSKQFQESNSKRETASRKGDV
jgi:hypothetical protein